MLASDDEFKLGQQYFHQSVILILEHHDKGSMGVILNRPTQYNMGYVSGDASGPFAAGDGGPVHVACFLFIFFPRSPNPPHSQVYDRPTS